MNREFPAFRHGECQSVKKQAKAKEFLTAEGAEEMSHTHREEIVTIKSVKALPGKKLRLKLSTGSELLLNMSNRLNTVRFCPLKDDALFNSVTTDGFYLHFDITPNYALDFTLKEAIRMSVSSPCQEQSREGNSAHEEDRK